MSVRATARGFGFARRRALIAGPFGPKGHGRHARHRNAHPALSPLALCHADGPGAPPPALGVGGGRPVAGLRRVPERAQLPAAVALPRGEHARPRRAAARAGRDRPALARGRRPRAPPHPRRAPAERERPDGEARRDHLPLRQYRSLTAAVPGRFYMPIDTAAFTPNPLALMERGMVP